MIMKLILQMQLQNIYPDFAKDHNNIFFIHGNRDFLVGDAFAQRGNFKLCSDPTYITFEI